MHTSHETARHGHPVHAAAALTHVVGAAPQSKRDDRDWRRELWIEAFAMSRRMIRPTTKQGHRSRYSVAQRWVHYLEHARRRFGASGWRVAQLAGLAVLDARCAGRKAFVFGDVAELLGAGLIRRTRKPRAGNLVGVVPYRCVKFERDRRGGYSLALTFDPLASSTATTMRRATLRQRRALVEARESERAYQGASATLAGLGRYAFAE